MFRAVAICLMLVLTAFTATMVWALYDLSLDTLVEPPSEPIIILQAADGSELARKGPLRHPPVAREDIPQHLVDAVLAIEDRRFYDHSGVDPIGILRASVRNLLAGGIAEGGSTLTQQLVKLRLGEDERTLRRKIREAAAALWLERRLSKGQILTEYLNSAYFGAGATGISAAARVYFDKVPSELTLEESALLAGLVTAPSRLNPLHNPEAARQRAAVVLEAMVDSRRLDRLRAEAANAQPAQLVDGRKATSAATWFADWVHGEAQEIARSFAAGSGGAVRVRTTLDPRLQAVAESIISEALDRLGEPNRTRQAALLAMRPDGSVVAMVGGRDYADSEFNRAVQAMRQPASAFKLFVYFAALRNGYDPEDTIEDAPVEIDGWRPENFGGRYHGTVTLAEAFARSLNAAAVRLAQSVGLDEVVEAARDLGIDAPLRATPSLALGTSEVSLLDLTSAYAAVLAGTAPVEPTGIAAFGGLHHERLLTPGPPTGPRHSLGPYRDPLIRLLKGVVEHGTGRAAALEGFAAGKTGTSADNRDAWFIGFNEHLVAGVWVGNDDGEPMPDITGGQLPASIWKAFMSEASRLLGPQPPAAEPDDDDLVAEVATEDMPEETAEQERPVAEATARALELPADDGRESDEPAVLTLQCDYDACARAYRSFRRSDCTFKPYRGPRRLCLRGSPTVTDNRAIAGAAAPASGPTCNVDVCSRFYRSFRRSDCTYQPYRGPRKVCRR